MGPGWVTGSSDDDPAGIGTYAYSGSRFGISQAWTMVFTLPLIIGVQELCARIGQASGRGLAGAMKQHHSREVMLFCVGLLLLANTFNLGADIGIMAASMQLVIDLPFVWWAAFFTILTLILVVFVTYKNYASYLKWLTISLLAYVVTVVIAKPDWGSVLQSIAMPTVTMNGEFLFLLVGILGTTISPYLFFWQASMEIEEEVLHGNGSIRKRKGASAEQMEASRADVVMGMLFSNFIALCVMLTAAFTLHQQGITIATASDAAASLKPVAGEFASHLFALGVVAMGLLAVPVLAGSASYAVCEIMGWRYGLYKKFHQAPRFYGVIIGATLVGLSINFFGIEPIDALVWSAVINGVISPILLTFIIHVGNNKKIMGKWKSGWLSNLLTMSTTLIMALAAVLMVVYWQ